MPVHSEDSNANRWLHIGVSGLLSAVAIWFVLRKLDFHALVEAIRHLDALSIFLIVTCFTIGLLLRGITCRIILGKKFTFADAFWAMNIGYLLNTIFPLRLGELGRAAVLVERTAGKSSFLEALAAIAAERFLDLLIGFSYLLFAIVFFVHNQTLKQIAVIGFFGLGFGLIMIVFLAKKREQVLEWLSHRFRRSESFRQKLLPAVSNLLEGFRFFLQPARLALAFVILAVSWFLSMLEFNLLQRAILSQSEFWWPILVIPASAFTNALPAAPGGLGVFEAGSVGAYALVGVEKPAALAMALVVHAVQIIIPAILGMIALFISGQSLSALIGKSLSFRRRKEAVE